MTCNTIKGIALYFLCDLNLNNYNRKRLFLPRVFKILENTFLRDNLLAACTKAAYTPTNKIMKNVDKCLFLFYILINSSDSENQLGPFIIVEMESKCNSAVSIFNKKRRGQVVLGSHSTFDFLAQIMVGWLHHGPVDLLIIFCCPCATKSILVFEADCCHSFFKI